MLDWKTFNPLTWKPQSWASLIPFGVGEQRPNNYLELTKALWENRDNLAYAWRILNDGVCDGCALGTTGMSDWTLEGPHLCNIRLRLLRLNTMPSLDLNVFADVSSLKNRKSAELRELGRIPYPMLRLRGEQGFKRISWEDALERIAAQIKKTTPQRKGFFLTSRGMSNESYYAVQKAVRAMGTNSIDNAARVCHAPSTVALKEGIGVSASTCSYSDWIGTELLIFVGSNVATNQPVATKYLHYAKQAGTQILCVNTYREPGMERYWVPSLPESALFGTKLTDHFFMVNTGGDAAFLNGVLKHLLECNLQNHTFIAEHTQNFAALQTHLEQLSWSHLERMSGSSELEMRAFGQMVGNAQTGVLVWSMGVTQHTCGEDNVRAIVNLGLAKGWVGRDKCGLMPIRGHSGVQGGAEMGAYASALPGGKPLSESNIAALERSYGFDLPRAAGLSVPEMLDAAFAGNLDILFSAGGNFMEVMPDPTHIAQSLERIALRVHMDLFLTSQMLVDGDEVIVLPAQTRYEMAGGITETSTERRVIFSPEIPGPRIGEARAEHEVFLQLAKKVRPDLELGCATTPDIRLEIAQVVPNYQGIAMLSRKGDQFQYGGPHLCKDGKFETADGKGHFAIVNSSAAALPAGTFRLSTRRGKQFNSMIHENKDAVTGASRDAVLINPRDAQDLGLAAGDAVELVSETGRMRAKIYIAPMQSGNVQVHWPEGNVLLDAHKRSLESKVPDYNAVVRIERVSG